MIYASASRTTAFFRTEVAGGAVLLVAAVVALTWASSPARDAYERLWHLGGTLRLGPLARPGDLHAWVNEGLMTPFFLVAGLEIKRELVSGELTDRRKALLPVVAAAGGTVMRPSSVSR